jgi:hypothetical protein
MKSGRRRRRTRDRSGAEEKCENEKRIEKLKNNEETKDKTADETKRKAKAV